MDFINQHILSFLIFFPAVAATGILLFKNSRAAVVFGLGASAIEALAGLHVWYHFDGSSADLQFTENFPWIPNLGIEYFVGIDGLSLLLVMLTVFLTPLVILSLYNDEDSRTPSLISLVLFLEGGMLGSLVSIDFVLFYVFWEVMLLPMYFIIGIWGGENRIYATTKFVIYTVVGSLLMLVAALGLYYLNFTQTGEFTTNIMELYNIDIPLGHQLWMFAAFMLAFAIKVPVWPFHTWLPDAHVQAPTIGSVILAGVMLKLGTYGFIRFAIPLFPDAAVIGAPIILGLAIVGIIYGALTAWVQDDAKKLVAYSSVSHLGFVVLGCLAIVGGDTISEIALTGSIYQMINHGISTGCLFFLVGIIYAKRHTRKLSAFGGLASVMPFYAIILIIATLGSVGLPGTGGFVGEFYILLGTFEAYPIAAILAASGVLLGALYMLKLCKEILFGPLDIEENKNLTDISMLEGLYLWPLAILIIVMGIFPNFFLDKTRPSIEKLSQKFKTYSLSTYDSAKKSQFAIETKQNLIPLEKEEL